MRVLQTTVLLAIIVLSSVANAQDADSGEAGRVFQGEAGHLFRFHSGQHSDLKPDTLLV